MYHDFWHPRKIEESLSNFSSWSWMHKQVHSAPGNPMRKGTKLWPELPVNANLMTILYAHLSFTLAPYCLYLSTLHTGCPQPQQSCNSFIVMWQELYYLWSWALHQYCVKFEHHDHSLRHCTYAIQARTVQASKLYTELLFLNCSIYSKPKPEDELNAQDKIMQQQVTLW